MRILLPLSVILIGAVVAACAVSPNSAPRAAAPTNVVDASQTAVHGDPVARLASADFVERSRASEVLVRAGASALPALGAAGAQPVTVAGGSRVSTTEPVVRAILAEADMDVLASQLRAPWPNVRRAAAEELGLRGSWDPIPELIVRLEDGDAGVRAASAQSLRRLTNNFFGFKALADSASRKAATDRWATWWSSEGVNAERRTASTSGR